MSDPPADTMANRAPRRQARRLADHILTAFHSACDQHDLEVAERLLAVLAAMVVSGRRHQPIGPDRRSEESLERFHVDRL